MNILSFDIEDWWGYKISNLESESLWLPRLNGYLDVILNNLDEVNYKATFFCLGEVAKSNPEVIKKIANRGHHIGCHSFSHNFFGKASYKEVEEDTKKAIYTIEDTIGGKIDAYRAPAFSITKSNKWIFEILYRYGIKYDCSIFPADRSFGGYPDFPSMKPTIVNYGDCEIKEFPIPIIRLLGREMAYSGGGYFRFIPYNKIASFVRTSDYVMTYFHIKDFDKEQARKFSAFNGENAISRYFKNYYGLNSAFRKFNKLIQEFNFMSVREADKFIKWDTVSTIKL